MNVGGQQFSDQAYTSGSIGVTIGGVEGSVGIPPTSGVLWREMDHGDKAICQLEEIAKSLEVRLDPVLSPLASDQAKLAEAAEKAGALTERLSGHHLRIRVAADRLVSILERLEL